MSAVADEVLPEYEERIVWVDALTDTAGGDALARRLTVGYIPTSLFIGADGTVAESIIGPLGADDLRARLDALIGE